MARKLVMVGVAGALSVLGIVAALVFLVFLPMCNNKLDGQATIDGKAFVPASCNSGQRWSFAGVQIEAADGRRLRAVIDATGNATGVVFAAGADRGVELGGCVEVDLHKQSSTINRVTNVEGQVTLRCANATGTISFANCH